MALKHGIASVPTASRILSGIDEELFLYAFMEWAGEIVNTKGAHIAIDGKALRGACDKARTFRPPMLMNVVETATGFVMAQLPMDTKDNEITSIPQVLRLLALKGSTITIDAIGTQTSIMEQIHSQGGHFVLMVKKNQSGAYEEIREIMEAMTADYAIKKAGGIPTFPDLLQKYDEVKTHEVNRERHEYRICRTLCDVSAINKSRKEWPYIKCIGWVEQVRVPIERDAERNDITPSKEEFVKNGSRRSPLPSSSEEGVGKDIQKVAMISDLTLSAKEMAGIKRLHWSIENRLHHVLDDTFREDRSPAKKSRNSLAIIRKFAYNILRLSMKSEGDGDAMTEMMDRFCDDPQLMQRFVFDGIPALY